MQNQQACLHTKKALKPCNSKHQSLPVALCNKDGNNSLPSPGIQDINKPSHRLVSISPLYAGGKCQVLTVGNETQCVAAHCPGAFVEWSKCQAGLDGNECPAGCVPQPLSGGVSSVCVPSGAKDLQPLTVQELRELKLCAGVQFINGLVENGMVAS
jgi:hypothetical protein